MTDVLLLYLFTRLNALISLFGFLAVIAAISCLGAMFFYGIERDELYPHWRKHVAVFIACITLVTVIPSKSDMAIIVGGKIALDVGRSETAQKVGQEVLDAIRAQLKRAAE